MDYSKLPFHIMEDQKILPGKLHYLLYPAPKKKEPVFIHPVSFSLIEQDAGTVFTHDFSDCSLLFYCLSGEGTLCYRGNIIPFGKRRGFFLDGNVLTAISSGAEGVQYTLYNMTGALTGELQRTAEEVKAFAFDSDRFHDFEQRQFLLVRSFPGELYGKEYDYSCHMNHLLVRILQLGPEASSPENDNHRQMIQQVLTYMHTHFSEDINIRDLAAHFHYSASQFQKCFQEQTLCSAKQYLIQLRIREAEKLLLNTNLSVEEVCTRCGFHNANHFIRVFRNYYGKTPLQYRKENRPER